MNLLRSSRGWLVRYLAEDSVPECAAVQLVEFITLPHSSDDSCLAWVSDGDHKVEAKFTASSIRQLETVQDQSMSAQQGAIITLKKFDKAVSPSRLQFTLVVAEFQIQGGAGSHVLFTPVDANNEPAVKRALKTFGNEGRDMMLVAQIVDDGTSVQREPLPELPFTMEDAVIPHEQMLALQRLPGWNAAVDKDAVNVELNESGYSMMSQQQQSQQQYKSDKHVGGEKEKEPAKKSSGNNEDDQRAYEEKLLLEQGPLVDVSARAAAAGAHAMRRLDFEGDGSANQRSQQPAPVQDDDGGYAAQNGPFVFSPGFISPSIQDTGLRYQEDDAGNNNEEEQDDEDANVPLSQLSPYSRAEALEKQAAEAKEQEQKQQQQEEGQEEEEGAKGESNDAVRALSLDPISVPVDASQSLRPESEAVQLISQAPEPESQVPVAQSQAVGEFVSQMSADIGRALSPGKPSSQYPPWLNPAPRKTSAPNSPMVGSPQGKMTAVPYEPPQQAFDASSKAETVQTGGNTAASGSSFSFSLSLSENQASPVKPAAAVVTAPEAPKSPQPGNSAAVDDVDDVPGEFRAPSSPIFPSPMQDVSEPSASGAASSNTWTDAAIERFCGSLELNGLDWAAAAAAVGNDTTVRACEKFFNEYQTFFPDILSALQKFEARQAALAKEPEKKRRASVSAVKNANNEKGGRKGGKAADHRKEQQEEVEREEVDEEEKKANDDEFAFNDDENEDEDYEVEAVLDERVVDGEQQYLLKWKGWPESDSTWVSEVDCEGCQLLIKKYRSSKKGPSATPPANRSAKTPVSKKITPPPISPARGNREKATSASAATPNVRVSVDANSSAKSKEPGGRSRKNANSDEGDAAGKSGDGKKKSAPAPVPASSKKTSPVSAVAVPLSKVSPPKKEEKKDVAPVSNGSTTSQLPGAAPAPKKLKSSKIAMQALMRQLK